MDDPWRSGAENGMADRGYAEGVTSVVGAWRWVRSAVALAICVIAAVVLVVGIAIGELRLADALILLVFVAIGIAFLLVRIRRIYPRVMPSGPGSSRRSDE